MWRSWWSVLWFPSWQKYYLSNLSGKYPDNIPPSLHLHCTVCTHPPQHLHPQTKPIVPKLLPTIWEQICQKCHYNFRVITLASASCSCSPCCYILSHCPSLKSLLELISMNQIRKSEVWRIRGNKWWTWKDPYLMFEYKSNFNWCSIKISDRMLMVDVDVDYKYFYSPRLAKIFDNLRFIFLTVSAIMRSSFIKFMLKDEGESLIWLGK